MLLLLYLFLILVLVILLFNTVIVDLQPPLWVKVEVLLALLLIVLQAPHLLAPLLPRGFLSATL
jgi:hypothetical protein